MAQTYTLRKFNDTYTYSTVELLQSNKWKEINDNATITKGDTLRISFHLTSNAGSWCKLRVMQVNGLDYINNSQMTVKGDVTVLVASEAGARTEVRGLSPAKPYIGDEATLDVFEVNDRLYCSVKIEAGSMVKYLSKQSNGTYAVTNTSSLFRLGYGSHKLKFNLPIEIYNSMPLVNFKSITITCTSFDEDKMHIVGAPHSRDFYVYAKSANAKPGISKALVRDINNTTVALTRDEHTLVRYMSQAKCDVTAAVQPPNSTKLAEIWINDSVAYQEWTYSNASSQVSRSLTFTGDDLKSGTFTFRAIDYRAGVGVATKTVEKNFVEYTKPVINNVEVSRYGGDDYVLFVNFYGYFYNGLFGSAGVRNEIRVRYRYRAEGENNFSNWMEIDGADTHYHITGLNRFGVFQSGTSGAAGAITIAPATGDSFDHTKSYTIQFQAFDGSELSQTNQDRIILSYSAKKTVGVAPSVPLFDWGKNDFNFNVPVKINNVNIFDIVYPVGSVYFHYSNGTPSSPPTSISGIGTWNYIGAAMSNIHAWIRTA